jgi:hypothetical protein
MNYTAALSRIRKATAEFAKVTADYRTHRISDEEYIAARKAYLAAEAEFDAAYAAAQFDTNPNGA